MAVWAMPSDPLPGIVPDDSLSVLLLRVAGHSLALPKQDVAEILPMPRLTPVPEAPPILLGAFHLAGEVVFVLPMAALLGIVGPAEGTPLYHHLLLLPPRAGRVRLAILVDRVTDIHHSQGHLLPPGESFNDCVEGDIRVDGDLVPVLSAAQLVTAYEAVRLSAFATRRAARNLAFQITDGV